MLLQLVPELIQGILKRKEEEESLHQQEIMWSMGFGIATATADRSLCRSHSAWHLFFAA